MVILLSPWALVATQWYSPESWVCTPLIWRDASDSNLTLPARAWMGRPALCQVKLWRMEPSTWQDSTATPPTGDVTFTAGFRAGGGSVLVWTQNQNHQTGVISSEPIVYPWMQMFALACLVSRQCFNHRSEIKNVWSLFQSLAVTVMLVGETACVCLHQCMRVTYHGQSTGLRHVPLLRCSALCTHTGLRPQPTHGEPPMMHWQGPWNKDTPGSLTGEWHQQQDPILRDVQLTSLAHMHNSHLHSINVQSSASTERKNRRIVWMTQSFMYRSLNLLYTCFLPIKLKK